MAAYDADLDAMPPEDRNLRWLLFDPEARRRLPEWAADVPDIVGRWRGIQAYWMLDVTPWARLGYGVASRELIDAWNRPRV